MRSLLHLFRRLAGPPGLQVVFSERYGRALPGVPLDPARGAQVLAFLLDRGLVRRENVHTPVATSLRNVLRAHTPEYLQALEEPETAGAIFGMPLAREQIQDVVQIQRLIAGGTIHATRLAIARHCTAAHLGGGLHHAAPDRGAGFCVFNDVAIAIRRLRAKGFSKPVLVVDLDLHDGNGTRAAFADDRTVHTFSIHNQPWDDRPAVASTDLVLGSGVTDEVLLTRLREALPPVIAAHRPGLVIYVAGADSAADDAVGDWALTSEGMLARDRFVTERVRALPGGVPFVIVLGGGYGYDAWRYTARYLAWLVSGRVPRLPDDMEIVLRRFRPVARELSEQALRAAAGGKPPPTSEWSLSEDDLADALPGLQRAAPVLGHYSAHGLELLFVRLGVFERLRAVGYPSPALVVEPAAATGHTVRVFGEAARQHLLIELRVARSRTAVPGCEVAFVDWLLLQNPRASFPPGRRPLPGQEHPGLGMLGLMAGVLVLACEQAGLDGVAHTLSNYHLAVVGRWHLRFVDPAVQARFEALCEALEGMPLVEAERALAAGRVVDDATGGPVTWEPALSVMPVSDRLRARVEGPAYDTAVAEDRRQLGYRLRQAPVAALHEETR